MFAGALVRVLERVLPRVPKVLVPPLSEVIGTLAYLWAPGPRAAVRANQLQVAPHRRPRVRRTFVNQVRNYFETFRVLRSSVEEMRRDIDVEGFEAFEEIARRGKGAVMASAHFGPVVVCGNVFIAHGYPVTLPVEKEKGEFARAVNRARTALGIRFVETDQAFGIARLLRKGGVLGVLADRAVTGVGERVEFFGKPALLPSGPMSLALRTGAALMPAFAYRRNGRLVAVFDRELELQRTGDHQADLLAGMRQFAQVMEKHIASAPEEWVVFERIWER